MDPDGEKGPDTRKMLEFIEDHFSTELVIENLRSKGSRGYSYTLWLSSERLYPGMETLTKRRRRKCFSFSAQAVRDSGGESSQAGRAQLDSLAVLGFDWTTYPSVLSILYTIAF
jgi:hypothetical protein